MVGDKKREEGRDELISIDEAIRINRRELQRLMNNTSWLDDYRRNYNFEAKEQLNKEDSPKPQ